MSNYWIKIPEPITQRNPQTGEPVGQPVTFLQFWSGTLCFDKRVSLNARALRSGHNIADAIERPLVSPSGVKYAKIADADYELLKQVAEEPQGLRAGPNGQAENGYPNGAFVQLFPHVKAIMDASSEEPADLKGGSINA